MAHKNFRTIDFRNFPGICHNNNLYNRDTGVIDQIYSAKQIEELPDLASGSICLNSLSWKWSPYGFYEEIYGRNPQFYDLLQGLTFQFTMPTQWEIIDVLSHFQLLSRILQLTIRNEQKLKHIFHLGGFRVVNFTTSKHFLIHFNFKFYLVFNVGK